jgi:hypothetical protein
MRLYVDSMTFLYHSSNFISLRYVKAQFTADHQLCTVGIEESAQLLK